MDNNNNIKKVSINIKTNVKLINNLFHIDITRNVIL